MKWWLVTFRLWRCFNIRHSPLTRWSTDAKRPEVRDSASNARMEMLGGDLATLMLGQPVTFPLRREPVSQLSRHLWSPIISQLPSLLPYQPNMLLLTRPCWSYPILIPRGSTLSAWPPQHLTAIPLPPLPWKTASSMVRPSPWSTTTCWLLVGAPSVTPGTWNSVNSGSSMPTPGSFSPIVIFPLSLSPESEERGTMQLLWRMVATRCFSLEAIATSCS